MLLCMLIGSWPLTLCAQSAPYWGITAGINLSKPKNDTWTSNSIHTSIRLGGLVGYDLGVRTHRPYLEAELLLSGKGWRDKVSINGTSEGAWSCHAYYLELPMRLGWKWAPSDRFALKAGVGPYLACGLWGKQTLKDAGGKDVSKEEYDMTTRLFSDTYRRFDWGLGGKVGVEIQGHWGIDLGYEASLREPHKYKTIFPRKDRSWSISASYLF